MFLLILYISLALGVSFLCSVLEAVLLSVTPSFVANLEDQRPGAGERLRALKTDIDKPLAAILSLNTVAHTIGAAGAGAQAMEVFGQQWVSVMSAILTLLILIVSEIIPKTLGAVYWRSLAPGVAYVLPLLIWVTYPLVLMSQWFSSLIAPKKKGPSLNREEFSALAQLLVKQGIFADEESSVLTNLLHFGSLHGADIMTPRTVLVGFPETATVEEATQDQEKLRFSRFPIWAESADQVTGLVLKHDLLMALVRGEKDAPLSDMRRDLLTLPVNVRLSELLNRMLGTKDHAALLVDDFGGTAGIVTLEDVVETLLGMEIVDEIDAVEDMQTLARKRWEERARQRGLDLGGLETSEGEAPDEAAAAMDGPSPEKAPEEISGDAPEEAPGKTSPDGGGSPAAGNP